jgi:hypothetical protein
LAGFDALQDPGKAPGLAVITASDERLVDALEQIGGALVAGAHHDAVGMQEVNDGRAFAEELGIRDHVEVLRGYTMAMQHPADPLVGVDRDRAFFHDDLVTLM